MSKLAAVEYLSLDGIFESPGWSGPYFDSEVSDFQYENLFASDALVLGRVTYEGFSAAWPSMTEDERGFGERMNSLPKHVASTTLASAAWNASLLEGDVGNAIAALKRVPGNDLLLNGSGILFNYLSRKGLIDEYRFMIYPVIVGIGRPLFTHGGARRGLTLMKSRLTPSGVAILTYVPDSEGRRVGGPTG